MISRIQMNNNKSYLKYLYYMNLQVVVILLLFNCDKAISKYENVLEEQEHIEIRDIKS